MSGTFWTSSGHLTLRRRRDTATVNLSRNIGVIFSQRITSVCSSPNTKLTICWPQQWVSYTNAPMLGHSHKTTTMSHLHASHNDGSYICIPQRWISYLPDPNDGSLPITMTHLVNDPNDESIYRCAPNTESLTTRLTEDPSYLTKYWPPEALTTSVRLLKLSGVRTPYSRLTHVQGSSTSLTRYPNTLLLDKAF